MVAFPRFHVPTTPWLTIIGHVRLGLGVVLHFGPQKCTPFLRYVRILPFEQSIMYEDGSGPRRFAVTIAYFRPQYITRPVRSQVYWILGVPSSPKNRPRRPAFSKAPSRAHRISPKHHEVTWPLACGILRDQCPLAGKGDECCTTVSNRSNTSPRRWRSQWFIHRPVV